MAEFELNAEADAPASSSEDERQDPTFEDLFGSSADEDDDEQVVVAVPSEPVSSKSRAKTKVQKAKAKKAKEYRRDWARRMEERKRKIEYENTVFSRACKRLAAQRLAARTVRVTPESELREVTQKMVKAMTISSALDTVAMKAGEPAVYKVMALRHFKDTMATGGVELRAYLSKQPSFFSAVRVWLAPEQGSLPHLELRDALLMELLVYFAKVDTDVLAESKIGGVIKFLASCSRETTRNRTLCSRIIENWVPRDRDTNVSVLVRPVDPVVAARRHREAVRAVLGYATQQLDHSDRARAPECLPFRFRVMPENPYEDVELANTKTGGCGGTVLEKACARLKRKNTRR